MQPIDVLQAIFYLFCGCLLGLLNAAIAKKFKLNPILGFVLGWFLPGISVPILIFLAKCKRTS